MDKIYTGNDRARELGFENYHAFLEAISGQKIDTGKMDKKNPVYARIDFSRWIADCGCGAAGYVDPKVNWFFCPSCKNISTEGRVRLVIFPDNAQAIEAEVLRREAQMPIGMFGTQGALNAKGLPRSWNPGETIEMLKKQREA